MKKKIIILLTILFLPFNSFAYSNKIIAGGESIGIEVNTKGIIVAGFYKVNSNYNKGNPKLKIGDYIIGINNDKINSISEMSTILSKYINNKSVILHIQRDGIDMDVELPLIYSNGKYKTGLYVKDKITGIGTLTYIDPETKIYGALGHQITASDSLKEVVINDGYIYSSSISSIDESRIGKAGSKNAVINHDDIKGNIDKNTLKGIFGLYDDTYDENNIFEVGNASDIKTGYAQIRTVIEGKKVELFDINITNIYKNSKQKNILFEITDKRLLDKTGGVVQGMSGSPIIQNNKIIGAVNYVVLDEPTKGYGIFITTMLKEGES